MSVEYHSHQHKQKIFVVIYIYIYIYTPSSRHCLTTCRSFLIIALLKSSADFIHAGFFFDMITRGASFVDASFKLLHSVLNFDSFLPNLTWN